mmetsp:Transcript_25413/g.49662  ORF Transcript_25413/g.49662 Transcript_25413/m.49662 type:complete len:88 (-) Transcript_25413:867-1130(-)
MKREKGEERTEQGNMHNIRSSSPPLPANCSPWQVQKEGPPHTNPRERANTRLFKTHHKTKRTERGMQEKKERRKKDFEKNVNQPTTV